ncbi:MAG: M3 family metallopeptidase, partial [Streptococcaceae bacterium]|nr:M3 family metallopeptidase [Streptococcaceae bacterium]
MPKLVDYQYRRPDYAHLKSEIEVLTETLASAKTLKIATSAIDAYTEINNTIDTMYNLAGIRFSVNMDDAFYKAEDDYWNEYAPKFGELSSNFSRVLIESPLRSALEKLYPKTMFQLAESEIKSFNAAIVSLKQAENRLSTQYNELIGSAQLDFEGEIYTLPEMTRFTTDKERIRRKAASEVVTAWYAENEAAFDDIYDKLVKNRHQQALTLGFENYAQMSLLVRQRFGYDLADIARYRKEILDKVVPVVEKLYQRQAQRNGIAQQMYYDLPLAFPNGNAKPKGTTAEKIAAAQKMYRELSTETGEFFDFLIDHELLDLESRKGK